MTMPEENTFARPNKLAFGQQHTESDITWVSDLIGQSQLKHPHLVGETIPVLVIFNPHQGAQVVVAADEFQTFLCNAITTLAVELTALKNYTTELDARVSDLDDPTCPPEDEEFPVIGGIHLVKE